MIVCPFVVFISAIPFTTFISERSIPVLIHVLKGSFILNIPPVSDLIFTSIATPFSFLAEIRKAPSVLNVLNETFFQSFGMEKCFIQNVKNRRSFSYLGQKRKWRSYGSENKIRNGRNIKNKTSFQNMDQYRYRSFGDKSSKRYCGNENNERANDHF